jgi:drug/metabolite transporter (DMT)-like permease
LIADKPILRENIVFLSFLGVIGYAFFTMLFYIAAHRTTAINIGILQGAIPIFVLLGGLLTYKTRIEPLQILGICVTLTGVALIVTAGDFSRLSNLGINGGDLLMLLACLCYAGYVLGLKRCQFCSTISQFTVMVAAAFFAACPFILIEWYWGLLQWPTPRGWLLVALITVFPSFLAQLGFIQGVALIGPGRAGIFINLVPVFASILAILLLGESFHWFHALALMLVLGGIGLSERAKATRTIN